MHKKENIQAAATFMLLGAVSLACMSVFVKTLGSTVGDDQMVFFRNFLGFLILLPCTFFSKQKSFSTKHFKGHLIRAIASALTLYCLFYSIRHILLADAILLNNTMPLFVPFIMFFWVGEKIPKGIVLPLLIAFDGVIFILHPDKNILHGAALIALFSGLTMAIATAGIRILGKNEPPYRIMFYTLGLGTLFTAIPLIWSWKTPSLYEFFLLMGLAVFGLLYQYCITKGYQFAHPTKVSPLIFIAVILSGIFDWIFWDKIPRPLSYFGLFLVFVGVYLCTRVESKKDLL